MNAMAQVVVRKIDDEVKKRLKERADRHGHSMEAEIRDILSEAVAEKKSRKLAVGTFIARHFSGEGIGIDFEIPEWRGEQARAARFRK